MVYSWQISTLNVQTQTKRTSMTVITVPLICTIKANQVIRILRVQTTVHTKSPVSRALSFSAFLSTKDIPYTYHS